MSDYFIMRQLLFAACIVICLCQISEIKGKIDLVLRQKRTLWGGDKPTTKTCLNFCNAVTGICGHGKCTLDHVTCAIKCKCDPGYTGQWCSRKDSATSTPSEQSTQSPVSKSVTITLHQITTTTNVPVTDQSSNINPVTDVISNSTVKPENDTEGFGNMSTSVERTTESILINSSVYESLEDCKVKCAFGQCLNLNGIIRCFPISVKGNNNKTSGDKSSNCPPGFSCDHGDCELQKNNIIYCRCERNWVGDLCHKHCPLDCGVNGYCSIVDHTTNQPGCVCDPKYTGSRCQELKPTPIEEEEVRHWYVIGVCVGVLFLLLVLILILPYWMWRRRWLFIMKIVYYFQHYEEDDGKEFDAFISYKSSKEDEKFVLEELYPKLEKEMGYKLCMHFRDFMPGDAIANNIIRAIENSRRTVMILSPNYIDSEWCRMEYQKAQHEMLKMKHKIIPVVLEDISKSKFIDKNLKTILNTVTYLEWPGYDQSKKLDRFWKHLELSMPKKHSSSEPLQSVTVSSSPSQIHLLSDSSRSSSAVVDSEIIISSEEDDSLSNISVQSSKPSEPPRGRLQKMVKEFKKLKITFDSRASLSRENSTDSCSSTPVTATPSPGVFLIRDNSPLIKSKSHRNKRSKSSTWSARSLRDSKVNKLHSRNSLREIDRCSSDVDVLSHIKCCANNKFENLPDICRTADGGYLNIVCETETPPSSPEESLTNIPNDMKARTECPTCVLNCDVENNKVELLRTVSSTSTDDNEAVDIDDRNCQILSLNIPPSNNNTKILNISELFVCAFCNNKNCRCCSKTLNITNTNEFIQQRNNINLTTISIESNSNINPPIAPARRKRKQKSVTEEFDDNGNKVLNS